LGHRAVLSVAATVGCPTLGAKWIEDENEYEEEGDFPAVFSTACSSYETSLS